MPTLPPLNEQAIREHVGEQSFARGLPYFRGNAIFDARRQGMALKARCEGSSAPEYRVEATFDDDGLSAAHCSCPVGAGGACKHVAALLLTWLEQPAAFNEVEALDVTLERKSKGELIALIKQMLQQEPDLETLVELPVAAPGERRAAVNPETYRRQAAAAFRGIGQGDRGAAAGVAWELQRLVNAADAALAQGDLARAAAVYDAVVSTTIDNYELVEDEDELAGVVRNCVAGLGTCLAAQRDAGREDVLRTLFTIYRADLEAGGYGLGDDARPLLQEQASAPERRLIATWLRAALTDPADGDDGAGKYARRDFGGFLLDLEEDSLDDAAYLRLCREAGLTPPLVERLLALGRVDEAAEETRRAEPGSLLPLAERFVAHGQGDAAERLVRERADETPGWTLLEWLAKRAEARGDRSGALDLRWRRFRAQPTLQGYRELRELAEPLATWEQMRPTLITFLEGQRQGYLLLQIALDEGDIDHALELLPPATAGFYGADPALQVAHAAEATRPPAALDLYRRCAERLIDQRGRDNYAAASHLLLKVRDLHARLGEQEDWSRYLANLLDRHRALRALKEELAAVGL